MENKPNIAKNIREIRIKEDLTQEKLAELSGLSINFVSRLERSNNQN
ncbi:helix-turn-helix domain-containing protein, partial [Oenococcus oeni]